MSVATAIGRVALMGVDQAVCHASCWPQRRAAGRSDQRSNDTLACSGEGWELGEGQVVARALGLRASRFPTFSYWELSVVFQRLPINNVLIRCFRL